MDIMAPKLATKEYTNHQTVRNATKTECTASSTSLTKARMNVDGKRSGAILAG